MTHLHVHSNYSLLEGTATIDRLIERAAACGMGALALTDTGGMYGAIPFYKAARNAGIKPILGTWLDGVVLLARNRQGYSQLCRTVTAYHLDAGFDLTSHLPQSGDAFVLTGDIALAESLRERGLRPLVAVSHDGGRASRYRAGRLCEAARRMRLRAVAVNPVYFLDADEHRIHRVLSAIRLNTTVDELNPDRIAGAESWFRSPEEMRRLYADWPETLGNAEWVAERCDLELELGTPLFPRFELPPRETPFSYLWKLAFDGVKQRYKPITRQVIERLRHELDVIERLGFAPYFIIVWDIVRHARQNNIPIVGRGSAANSVVAYALGITRVDPLGYDLYFERFLNPSRTDCPDIDLDICWRRREQVVDYVYERHGADRVAMISTFNTFQARSAVREVAKAFGMTDQEASDMTRGLPHYHAGDIRAMARNLPECRGLHVDEEPLKSIIPICEFIDGFPRHLSLHPCGLVITPAPLTDFVPLQRAAKGLVVTQYDMGPVEDMGLVKMDLLGHRSLTVIDDTVRRIWENRGIRVDVEALPDPDRITADLIRAGRTIGCFQIESPAMRALLRNTSADSTDMLIKTLSLVRPGPSGSGMKKRFIARRLGKEETAYPHPLLEPVLRDTHGVMLYQEDILKVASVIAGMNLAEADCLRRAMTKKRSTEEMAANMKTFMEKAMANGVDREVAERIWELISNFAAYSYCKAHACTYGELAYQCTYLKAHFPAEFMASVLSNRGGFYHPAVYVEEARRLGVQVRPPDVNRGWFEYSVQGDSIRMGLVEVRGLSSHTVEMLIAAREDAPFTSITDLALRTGLSRPEAETLIAAGACDGFGRTRPGLLWELRMLGQGLAAAATGAGQAQGLFAREISGCPVPKLPDYSRRKRIDSEWSALGLTASTHPLEYYASAASGRTLVLSEDIQQYAGRSITLFGWLIAERRVALKGRGCMKFCTFEDPKGVFEGVLFPSTYQKYGHLLNSHGPFFVTGEIQDDDNYCSVIVNRIERVGHGHRRPDDRIMGE